MSIEQIKIGARGSPLSLAQTGWLRIELAKALNIAPDDIAVSYTHLDVYKRQYYYNAPHWLLDCLKYPLVVRR